MLEIEPEYVEFEKHLIHDKKLHIDMAKRWREVDDGIDNFVTKHGTNALSFILGILATFSMVGGFYLFTTGKLILGILGFLLISISFILGLLTHRANNIFKKRLAESIFFSFCFPHMLDTQTQQEKTKAADELNHKIRSTACLLARCSQALSTCSTDDKEKHDELVRIIDELTNKLHTQVFSDLPYNYERCASEIKDGSSLSDAVIKAYPTVHS